MRRRTLQGGSGKKLLLSEYSYQATPAAGSSKTFNVLYGKDILMDTGVTIAYGGQISSASYNSSNGKVTYSYNSNTDTSRAKSGTITVSYNGQSVIFTLNQPKDYCTSSGYHEYSTDAIDLDYIESCYVTIKNDYITSMNGYYYNTYHYTYAKRYTYASGNSYWDTSDTYKVTTQQHNMTSRYWSGSVYCPPGSSVTISASWWSSKCCSYTFYISRDSSGNVSWS